VCCSVSQCLAVSCSVYVAGSPWVYNFSDVVTCTLLEKMCTHIRTVIAVCCSVLQCLAVHIITVLPCLYNVFDVVKYASSEKLSTLGKTAIVCAVTIFTLKVSLSHATYEWVMSRVSESCLPTYQCLAPRKTPNNSQRNQNMDERRHSFSADRL